MSLQLLALFNGFISLVMGEASHSANALRNRTLFGHHKIFGLSGIGKVGATTELDRVVEPFLILESSRREKGIQ